MKKTYWFLLAVIIVAIYASMQDSNKDTKKTNVMATLQENATDYTSKPICDIKDIDILKKTLNNTIWTHTTKGDVWFRYEFVGNIVKQYSALPADGKWEYDGDSEYTLSEHRSQIDGKRFIVATFFPKPKSLAMFELPVVFNFRDYHLYLDGKDIGGFIMSDYEWD